MNKVSAIVRLRLSKLPERTPVRLTIVLDPASHALLQEYSTLYSATYGQEETLSELIPFMLRSFVEGDKAFVRARRSRDGKSSGD
jgi:hypothetical protein